MANIYYSECCESDDCIDECNCDTHGCTFCGLEHGCRCDADYDEWAGK